MINSLLKFMAMKQLQFIKSEKFWLGLIFILGLAIRFYKLGQVPSGFVNDEAAFGYNAFSLLKTGKDEFGQAWPIIFRSFGEGKLPVYVYLTMPSILIFGLTEFAVRFPSALFGSLTVLLVYFLAKNFERQTSYLALITSLVLATLPWHIHFSRAAFEANVSLFLIVFANWLFLKKRVFGSLIAFTLAIFTYNGALIFVPLWLIYLFLHYKQKKILWIFFPWLLLLILQSGSNRFSGINIFNAQSGVVQRLQQKFTETRDQPLWLTRAFHNKPVEFTVDFVRRYASHFDSNFLFFNGDPLRPRYRVPDTGQALWFTFPFFFLGLYFLAKHKHWPILVWLLLAPLPAAITFETPSAIRAILMILPLSLAIALGVSETIKRFPWIALPTFFVFSFSFLVYLDAYFIHAPVHQPYEWQGGYKELVKRINKMMPDYDKALITDSRGTAYIYFLFYNQYDPAKWQTQANESISAPDKFGFSTINHLENLYFIGENCPAKIPEEKVLYVCTQEDRPPDFSQLRDTINFDDKQPAFVLYEKSPN